MHYFFIGQCSAAAAAKLLRSCPTLCDPIDGSPSGSPVPGILQARTLEWVAIVFCIAWKWKVKVNLLSRVRLLATPWTAAHQPPLSMGFARQEYWSGVPLPSLVQCYRHMLIFPKTPFRTQAMMVSSFFVFNDRFLVTVIDSPLFSICTTSCVLASTKILLTFVNFLWK